MQSTRDVNARGEDLEPRIIEHGGVRKINMHVATACCKRDLSQINFRTYIGGVYLKIHT